VLQEAGYRITAVSSSVEALDQFRTRSFDLVVTGYKMPKMSGIELIEQIRLLNAVVPVILISGYADALGLDSQSTGADVVIQKSANEVSHLLRAVARLVKRKTPRKPAGSQSSIRRAAAPRTPRVRKSG
jgi:CheY-like chemotaxis protein